jgi:hypothetical protein
LTLLTPSASPRYHQAPEIVFQPSIIGLDQAGLSETIQRILKRLDSKEFESVSKVLPPSLTSSLSSLLIFS